MWANARWYFCRATFYTEVTSTRIYPGNTLPKDFALEQNYPNPFNPGTVIRYAILRDEPVELRIFDINARVVATLVDGYQSAGRYEVHFDGRNSTGEPLVAGVYFYRIRVGSYQEMRKLLLLKWCGSTFGRGSWFGSGEKEIRQN